MKMFNKKALFAGLLGAMFATAALAVGIWQGFPAQTAVSGVEYAGFDTGNPNGLNPATVQISTGQIAAAAITSVLNPVTASNVASFTATAAQVTPPPAIKLIQLTGTLTANSTITTPTAASWIAQFTTIPPAGYTLVILNQSSGAFSWTVAGGVGVTTNGNMVIAQTTTAVFNVQVNQSAGTITVTRVS